MFSEEILILYLHVEVLLNQKNKHEKSGGDIFEKCVRLCCISPSSALLRSDLFKDIGYFDESFPACEDYDFWLRVTAREKVLFLDEPLTIKYGGHDDQLSKKYWGMDRFRVKALEKLILNQNLNNLQKKIILNSLITRLEIINKYQCIEDTLTRANHFSNVAIDSVDIFKDNIYKEKLVSLVSKSVSRMY